jgi:hypothetical protein
MSTRPELVEDEYSYPPEEKVKPVDLTKFGYVVVPKRIVRETTKVYGNWEAWRKS